MVSSALGTAAVTLTVSCLCVIARSINVADSIGGVLKAWLAHPEIATEKHRDSVTRNDRSEWQYIFELVSFDEDVIVAYVWSSMIESNCSLQKVIR